MVPGDSPLIAVGYNYNVRKVLSVIVTDNTRSTKTGIPYVSKYPDQFTNVAIRPVARPLVMLKTNILLMRLTPSTNQGILVWHWISYGLISVVGCSYVSQLLWELLFLIVGNCFVM